MARRAAGQQRRGRRGGRPERPLSGLHPGRGRSHQSIDGLHSFPDHRQTGGRSFQGCGKERSPSRMRAERRQRDRYDSGSVRIGGRLQLGPDRLERRQRRGGLHSRTARGRDHPADGRPGLHLWCRPALKRLSDVCRPCLSQHRPQAPPLTDGGEHHSRPVLRTGRSQRRPRHPVRHRQRLPQVATGRKPRPRRLRRRPGDEPRASEPGRPPDHRRREGRPPRRDLARDAHLGRCLRIGGPHEPDRFRPAAAGRPGRHRGCRPERQRHQRRAGPSGLADDLGRLPQRSQAGRRYGRSRGRPQAPLLPGLAGRRHHGAARPAGEQRRVRHHGPPARHLLSGLLPPAAAAQGRDRLLPLREERHEHRGAEERPARLRTARH